MLEPIEGDADVGLPEEAVPPGKRADALDCSPDHRTRYHRERVAARHSGQVRLEQAQAVLGPLADQIAAVAAGLRADLEQAVADTLAQAQAARAGAPREERGQHPCRAGRPPGPCRPGEPGGC